MLKHIKNYFIMRSICNRYGITLKIHTKVGRGSFNYSAYVDTRLYKLYLKYSPKWLHKVYTGFRGRELRRTNIEIKLCPWDSMLWETFFHELGHIMDLLQTKVYTKGIYGKKSLVVTPAKNSSILAYMSTKNRGDQYGDLLLSEAKASRYAVKYLKSTKRFNSKSLFDLNWSISTYTKGICKEQIADIDYKLIQYIKGNGTLTGKNNV